MGSALQAALVDRLLEAEAMAPAAWPQKRRGWLLEERPIICTYLSFIYIMCIYIYVFFVYIYNMYIPLTFEAGAIT